MLTQLDLKQFNFPIIGFIGQSGSGKTTLLKKIIPILKEHNLTIALIKHTHHKIKFDNKGITKKLLSKKVDIACQEDNQYILELQQRQQHTLLEAISDYQHLNIDLLLIEGFKHLNYPKIEIYRSELKNQLIYNTNQQGILAIASDKKTLKDVQVPILDLNSPEMISHWILTHIIK